MGFGAILQFDEKSERAIVKLQKNVFGETDAGTRGLGPHVTLAVWDTIDQQALSSCAASLASNRPALSLRFEAVGSFPGGASALVLMPALSRELAELHEVLHASLDSFSDEAWPEYQPGRWVPHCTLAMGVAGGELGRAFEESLGTLAPLEVRLTHLVVAEFYPMRTIGTYLLSP